MAAWWVNDVGPALMMQDDESGGLRYSLCNSNSTPIFPNDTTITAPLNDYPPKRNTSLAGSGWFTGGEYFVSENLPAVDGVGLVDGQMREYYQGPTRTGLPGKEIAWSNQSLSC